MKRALVAAIVMAAFVASAAQAEPPIFKDKKYFGPIPYNGFSVGVGFLDGTDFDYLFEHLQNYAVARNGSESWEEVSVSPYAHLRYERQMTPNHFLKLAATAAYVNTSGISELVATIDTNNYYLQGERTFKVYLLSLDVGLEYYFVSPEPQRFSPYVGGGFAAVVPITKLSSDFTHNGEPFPTPGENVDDTEFRAGLHFEFGMNYYVSNRLALGLEGKYQMSQSKFEIHDGNFDLSYAGFMLTLNVTRYL